MRGLAPMREEIAAHLAAGGKLLGICVGMHVLYEGSEESPGVPGLGLLKGRVRKLDRRPLPRIGWGDVPGAGGEFYFMHSYGVGVDFVQHGAITGVQFHPEKSGAAGLEFLRAWARGLNVRAVA